MSSLFHRLIEASGISVLFADHALRRACERAGVDATQLSPATLKLALPEIERTVRTFLDKDSAEAMTRIRSLARLG